MQVDVRNKIRTLKLSLVVLLETMVKQASYNYIANSILPACWKEVSNLEDGSTTARIWMMWDPQVVHATISSQNPQCMHCDIKYGTVDFLLSMCYGYNNYMQHRDLWKSVIHRSKNSGLPWIVAGDF